MPRPKSYKQVNVNFNLENDNEKKIYEYLNSKRGKGNYIKDLIEADMNGVVVVATQVDKKEEVTINNNDLDEWFE